METYTELQETEREKASIASADTEEVEGINEGVFFFKNQAVLDRLSENEKNELTYRGKVLQYEVQTGVVTYPSPDWFYISAVGNSWLLVDMAYAFQEGTKILDVEFWFSNKWVSVNSMFRIDAVPYTVFMDRVFFDMGEPAIIMVHFPDRVNSVFNALNEGAIEQMRVTFLPKSEEVTNE